MALPLSSLAVDPALFSRTLSGILWHDCRPPNAVPPIRRNEKKARSCWRIFWSYLPWAAYGSSHLILRDELNIFLKAVATLSFRQRESTGLRTAHQSYHLDYISPKISPCGRDNRMDKPVIVKRKML